MSAVTSTERLTLTMKEAAALLGVSLPVMYETAHRADFPLLQFGRKMLVSRSALERWIENHAGGGDM